MLNKRLFDLLVVMITAIPALILGVTLAAVIRLRLGSPALFWQERPGFGGGLFRLVKFRTMTDDRDEHNTLLPDEERLTAFGKWLRATSLDELPELWNVLKGEMSLVGPRPLLPEYLPLYSDEQARRHNARPGITGWAQVNGRNDASWEDRFDMDVWYVDNWSLSLDLKILLRTVVLVFSKKGVNAEGHATMPRFRGSS